MANMSLGGYTFAKQPSGMTMIQKDRIAAHAPTYTSVAFYSWGASIIGKVVELTFNYITTGQYASLQTLYEADAQVVFNPQDGSSKTYNVEILSLNSEYHIQLNNTTGNYRKGAQLRLLILSEV
jgi:hypothetical protein